MTPEQTSLKDITRALAFLAERHKDTGLDSMSQPFIHHPVQVLNELVQADITDTVTLTAAVLHDIRQKTSTTEAQIVSLFGTDVADLVNELYYETTQPKVDILMSLIDRQVDLSDKAKQVVFADLIANFIDANYDTLPKLTQRAMASFARALFEKTSDPHPKLEDRFQKVLTALEMGVSDDVSQ